MQSFSRHDLKKHLDAFNDLKYQAYIANELFYILANFCAVMHPVYEQFTKQNNIPNPDIIIRQFYTCCIQQKGKDLFLCDCKNLGNQPIQTSPSMITTLCAGVAAIIEDEKLSRLKTTSSKQKYIHEMLPQILPEIHNGSIVRFNQLIELTRKTLIDVVTKNEAVKTGLKIGLIQNKLKQNKADIFRHAEQMGLIPSADVLTQYQQARDIIFAHPGKYPTNSLNISNGYTYTNKKGMNVTFNPSYFGITNIIENYEKILAKMLNIPQNELSRHLPNTMTLNTNAIEAGISIEYLEGSRQLRKKIVSPLPASQSKETKKDTTLRNRLEHAQETPKTLIHLKDRQSTLFNKNKKLTLNWLFELLSHQHDS